MPAGRCTPWNQSQRSRWNRVSGPWPSSSLLIDGWRVTCGHYSIYLPLVAVAYTVICRRGKTHESRNANETEASLNDEVLRQGVSVEALLERLMRELAAAAHVAASSATASKLPRLHLRALHLGDMGTLHRSEIYHDVR